MVNPVGEENWLAYLEEIVRNASDLEQRVNAVEHYKLAVGSEPGSLRIWLAYCNYFWSLWEATQTPTGHGWSDEERMLGRELFSFGGALDLWQQGYEAIRYRLGDSHLLWDRWISLEMELLAKTRTPEGIKRITHLYRDRLLTPHLTWDETSQNFSTFLSEYNRTAWEESMKDVTTNAQETKRLIAARDPYESALKKAVDAGDVEAQKTAFTTYLEWEMLQSKRSNDNPEIGIDLCRGLYARALTGALATDQNTWYEYIVFLSSSNTDLQAPSSLLDVLRRAVQHCPWSGLLWNRYIMCAEEAKRPFAEVESIKHSATSEDQLLKDGMEGMIEMYVAWCGFLKRNAMDASASDEAVDVADVGLIAALEDVSVVGKRLYDKDFQGDPKFRLERIYIQYLTEKKGAVDEARAQWNKLAALQIHADNHDFWFRYYMWEMLIFSSAGAQDNRSPTPSSGGGTYRIPTLATAVLTRAVARRTIDWPEKVLEVYMQHCNDYEMPLPLRKAADRVHKTGKEVKKRREREEQEKAAAYAAYYTAPETLEKGQGVTSPGGSKRKRDLEVDPTDGPENNSKRQRNEPNGVVSEQALATQHGQPLKRDRENSTILVSNLPADVDKTKLRQYFKEYGHINNITALVREEKTDSSTALIEFKSPEEAQSALLRDGKYFGQSQLTVKLGNDLTVYVANYPPAADQKYIRDLFKDCGEILSIRLPSLKVDARRRFCYVSFRDQEASAKAVKKDGTVLEGGLKLLAKYSDPSHKKAREGALAEGREIHISNLDRTATEADLKEVFSKYGNVTRVNLPRNLVGKTKGFAFIDFATKEEAEKAVAEMNNTKFKSQILEVALSKESKIKRAATTVVADTARSSPAPSPHDAEGDEAMEDAPDEAQSKPTAADISAKTIALMGLPDTVNDARIRALVEPLGAIVKLTVLPGNGGAKIEFVDAATAGKASLQLNSMDFEGHKLRTGTMDELRQAKAERTQDRIVYGKRDRDRIKGQEQKTKAAGSSSTTLMPPPTTIRRPVLGKPGPRRGLGFKPSAPKPAQNGDSDTSSKKSNADFKAMFLASGQDNKKGDEGEKPGSES
ncbi:putative RNA-binding protein [Fusarium oxysporum f. sp. cubense]|uniref:Putative RNA-binding protein n=1 Tax=Fusarium oxysporum f. sp. cubense TaxID=61366 RepID=A0A559L2L0_FUSOC|nr:putative RNA-binding protein [Fusarium oxysporum f. sp. cubense]